MSLVISKILPCFLKFIKRILVKRRERFRRIVPCVVGQLQAKRRNLLTCDYRVRTHGEFGRNQSLAFRVVDRNRERPAPSLREL